MSDNESFTDTYTRRRTIEADEPTESVVWDIEETDEGQYAFVIESAGEYYRLRLNSAKVIKSDYAISKLVEWKDGFTVGTKIDVYFNSDMSRCGFSEDNYAFDLEHLGDNYQSDNSNVSIESIIDNLLLQNEYKRTEALEDDGWRLNVSSVSGCDSDSFNLSVRTESLTEIEWTIDIPLTTEKESSETARLIEEQGGGSPDLIDTESKVNVVKKEDVPENLNVISYDRTDEWALVNPSTFDDWFEKRVERQKDRMGSKVNVGLNTYNNYNSSSTDDNQIYGDRLSDNKNEKSRSKKNRGKQKSNNSRYKSSRSNSIDYNKYHQMQMKGIMHGFLFPVVATLMSDTLLTPAVLQPQNAESAAMLETFVSVIDLLIMFSVIIGFLMVVIGTAGKMMTKN